MINYVKGFFSPSIVEKEKVNNPCYYCGKELSNRITIKQNKKFHQGCVKKWLRNEKRSLINE